MRYRKSFDRPDARANGQSARCPRPGREASLTVSVSDANIISKTVIVNCFYKNYNRFCYFAENAGAILYNFNKAVISLNRIKDLRIKTGMKQSELSNRLNCAAMTVSRYERGEADPDIETICRLCDIFGCTADYLLGRSDRQTPELTAEEEQLLAAWASAPPEIRAIIETALAPYQQDATASAPTA